MKTIQNKTIDETVLSYYHSHLSPEMGKMDFIIQGLTNERSYEDRDVYFHMKCPESSDEVLSYTEKIDHQIWLRGEDAIEFGMKLIEHGKFALECNMFNHQAIHMNKELQRFLDEDIVEEVEFQMIDESPANYGEGYRTYCIRPYWKEGMAPEYQEDFTFEVVIYWSPFEETYQEQLDYYTRGCSYSIIGYDHDLEVERFKEQVRLMSGD